MQDGNQPGSDPNQPGWVFKPGDSSQDSGELPQVSADVASVQTPPIPVAAPENVVSSPPVTKQESTFIQGDNHITWTASEYIASPKSTGWYIALAISSIVLAAIVYLVTQEIVPTVVIAILGILVGVFAARQPQTLQYQIDNTGLSVGNRSYPYSSFKAFSIAREHAIGFIQLLPLKRFMPPLVIHYAPEDEDSITDVLSAYLPYEDHKPDMVDNLTRRLRF